MYAKLISLSISHNMNLIWIKLKYGGKHYALKLKRRVAIWTRLFSFSVQSLPGTFCMTLTDAIHDQGKAIGAPYLFGLRLHPAQFP